MAIDPQSPSRYALIVANSDYQDQTLRRLRAPSRDAEELARVLGAAEIGGFQVEQSTNEPAHLLRRRMAKFFADRNLDDVLLVHLSGHGVKDEDGSLYFAASDTDSRQLDATAIAAEFLNRQMAKSRSKSIVLFLDCCFSGAFARGALARGSATVGVKENFGGQGKIVLTSSNSAEYSLEGADVEGEGSPSFFTTAVVEGLETGAADRDGDQLVSVDELYDYVFDAVRGRTPNQTPCKWTFDVRGDIFLARNPTPIVATTTMLPEALLEALDNPISAVREGAANELAKLLTSRDQRMAAAARLALTELLDDDSRRVSQAAHAVLEGGEVTVTEAGEPVPRAPERVAAPAPPEPEPAIAATSAEAVKTLPSVVEVETAPAAPPGDSVVFAPQKPEERDRRLPAAVAAIGVLCVLAGPFLHVAGSNEGTLLSLQNSPFRYLIWFNIETFGIAAAVAAVLVMLVQGRVAVRFAAGALVGLGIQTTVGGFGVIRYFGTSAYHGPGLSPAGAALTAGGLLVLAAGIMFLRSSARAAPDSPDRPPAAGRLPAAWICLAGAILMFAGLVVPVSGLPRILTTAAGGYYWFGLEIVAAVAVVVAGSLLGASVGSVVGRAMVAAVGLQSALYFLGFAGGWTTAPFPTGAKPGDFLGLIGAAIVMFGSLKMRPPTGEPTLKA